MAKLLKFFRLVLTTLMCILTGLNAISICMQVVIRFFFKTSMAWVTEFAGVSLVWITFLGASLATLDETNINFNGLIEKLSGTSKLFLKTLVNVCILFMTYILIRYGFKSMGVGLETQMVALPTTMGVCCSVIPISGVFMAIAAIINIVKDIKECFGITVYSDNDSIAAIYDDVPEEIMEKASKSFNAEETTINNNYKGDIEE